MNQLTELPLNNRKHSGYRNAQSPVTAALENADLLREIGKYVEPKLPFILSFKAARDALRPLGSKSGQHWIISKKKSFVTSVAMVEWAQSEGCVFRIGLADHLWSSIFKCYSSLFCLAAANGAVDVLQWALDKYPSDQYPAAREENICDSAARHGQLGMLRYLRSLDPPCDWGADTCSQAALGGHFEVILWLRSQEPPCEWGSRTTAYAAHGGHFSLLQWLCAQEPPCPLTSAACSHAAGAGHLDVLKWLRSREPPYPWDSSSCFFAAKSGHLHVLEWLRSQVLPCPWADETGSSCSYAAMGGNLSVLQWLKAQEPPCPWDTKVCLRAAERGHLQVLQWVRAQEPPAPWDERVCAHAAKNGHLPTLQWLRTQDPPCPWDEASCLWAVRSTCWGGCVRKTPFSPVGTATLAPARPEQGISVPCVG